MGEITVEHEPPHMTDDVWKVRVGGRLIGLARDKAAADLLSGAEDTRDALRACLEALRQSEREMTKYIKHAQATNPMARYAGAGGAVIALRDRMSAAITTAEKALGEA